jgi:hypothetical protein
MTQEQRVRRDALAAKDCPFLALPHEVRDIAYEYVLI